MQRSPYEDASFLSKTTSSWVTPLIQLGYERPLEPDDIPNVPASFSASVTCDLFEERWKEEVSKRGDRASAGRVLLQTYRKEIVLAWLAFLPCVGISLLQPYLVNDLLVYITDGKNSALQLQSGVALALLLGFLSIGAGLFKNSASNQLMCVGFAMKAAVVAAIFKKSLRLSSAAKAQQTSGQMITLISGDAERLWNSVLQSNWLWAGPLLIVVAMVLLILEAGWAAVAAVAAMVVVACVQSWIGVQVGEARKRQVLFTDERTKVVNEVLQGIRIIKFYAWEKATERRIAEIRKEEVKSITRYQLMKMVSTIFIYSASLIIGFVLFIVYLRLGGDLSVAKVYKLYALLNVIRMPFSITPMSWTAWQEGQHALSRISAFLSLEEMSDCALLLRDRGITSCASGSDSVSADSTDDVNLEISAMKTEDIKKSNKDCLLSLRQAAFSWDPSTHTHTRTLQDITLDIDRDDFVAIVGSVGSGKSSLIAALLGQMVCTQGEAHGLGTFRAALVAQEHWIQNMNLRENVLFDTRFEESAYAQALESSQLVKDLLVLSCADETSIGERGLNLSGGQKARISIARALYAGNHFPCVSSSSTLHLTDSSSNDDVDDDDDEESCTSMEFNKASNKGEEIDMFIFDDSLASVDVHVGKALFEHAICSPVASRVCRVVSLSSNYHFLRSFSKIVVMEQGRVAMVGSFEEIASAFPAYNMEAEQEEKTEQEDEEEVDLDEALDEVMSLKENNLSRSHTFPRGRDASLAREISISLSRAPPAIFQNKMTFDSTCKKIVPPKHQHHRNPTDNNSQTHSHAHTHNSHGVYAKHFAEIARRREAAKDLITEEEREKGAVSLRTYATYFSFLNPRSTLSVEDLRMRTSQPSQKNEDEDEKEDNARKSVSSWQSSLLGGSVFSLILLLFSLNQVARVYSDLWLGSWATDREDALAEAEPQTHSDAFYYDWFIVLVWATVGLCVLCSIIFILASLGASRSLHHILLKAVLKAPINTYFDVTPAGRILNRFSKDLDAMDTLLPDFFLQMLHNAFSVLSNLIVCLISSPFFVLLFLPLSAALFIIQLFYRKSSRELKRLESVSRSPVYSLFSEALQGLMTIRAYRREHVVTEKFFRLLDRQLASFFVFYTSSRWLALRLDMISNLVVFTVAVLSVILKETGSNSVDPNMLGVALVYSLQLTGLMQWTVRFSIETETNMTSVERLFAFSNIEPEKAITLTSPNFIDTNDFPSLSSLYPAPSAAANSINVDDDPDKSLSPSPCLSSSSSSRLRARTTTQEQELEFALRFSQRTQRPIWPSAGCIELCDVTMRYRSDLPPVLNCVSLHIPGGKKVGVCGRTGAGKSSLMLALFRIVECEAGSRICIDGEDIRSVPLSVLRSRVTIIPQDPFMFSGTLRENLDPFHSYTDAEIWEALDRVHLKEEVVGKFPEKLQHKVSERGENISMGQRQLVCIARALLRKSQIIVMDEATASVDSATDAKIQSTIKEQFRHCTVLTIAHRLETIADYDLIVVMDHGHVVECGPPLQLLSESEDAGCVCLKDEREGEGDPLRGIFRSLVDGLGAERKQAFFNVAMKKASETLSDES